MNRTVIIAIGALLLGLLGWWALQAWTRHSPAIVTGDVTYIDTETKEIVTAPAQPTPATNPKTGRRSLVVAVKSPKGDWIPAPPDEVQREQQRSR